MFEDALVESSGRIKTRSRQYSVVGVLLNGVVLAGLVLAPLLSPEALPRAAMLTALVAPPAPAPPPQPLPVRVQVQARAMSELDAPARVPRVILVARETAPPQDASAQLASGNRNGPADVIGSDFGTGQPPVVRRALPPKKIAVSQGVMAGNILFKPEPTYPAIAKQARIQGTVVLSATISKSGSIENLSVVGGPQMLAPAALDAVRQWRYKPYQLNGYPVEVQTQINVTFSLGN